MLNAKRRDARVVRPPAGDLTCRKQRTQRSPVLIRLGQQHKTWRLEPGIDLIDRRRERRRRTVDARMCDDGKKLVQARPENSPSGVSFGETGKLARRNGMKGCVLAMRINQDVGVDSDQDRPS